MARTKVTLRKGEKGVTQVLRTRAVTQNGEERKRPSSPIHPPPPAQKAPPEAEEIMRRIAEAEQLDGGEVSINVTDLTVGPEGCRGWAI